MTPFSYPAAPYRRRHGPQGYAHYTGFRSWLRDEFDYRCAYCLLREQWGRVRGTFDLDHFRPVARHPEQRHTYDNLLYCCATCNVAKADRIIPDPGQVFVKGDVTVHEDGVLEARTREARRLVRKLGLDDCEAREFRLLWIGNIALAERYDPALHHRLLGYPENLPDLSRLRPPGGNTRPEGVKESAHARRQSSSLPAI